MNFEVRNLTKRYGELVALDNVSFDLPQGEIIGFIGANGAGKTTALRIMSGLEEPDSGDVTVDGVSVIDYPDRMRRKIGFMPDALPDASDVLVDDYLEFFADSFIPSAERQKKLAEIEEFTQVGSFLNRRLSDLSKGMKQRVSLARLLIHDPEVLLLDEPAAGLDPLGRAELNEMLKSLAGRGKTIFLSSHILAELESMISCVVIIDRGRILRHGRLDDASLIRQTGTADDRIERVEIDCLGAVAPQYIDILKGLPGVTAVIPNGSRGFICDVVSENFSKFMMKLGESGFPLGGMKRIDRTVVLEKLFLDVTRKGVR